MPLRSFEKLSGKNAPALRTFSFRSPRFILAARNSKVETLQFASGIREKSQFFRISTLGIDR